MAGETVGMELGYLVHVNERRGASESVLSGYDQRLVTRCVLQLGKEIWVRFGVGWDLDPGDGLYDGGGMTLTAGF